MRDRPALDLRMLAPVSVGVFAIAILAVLIVSGTLSGGESADPADERNSDRSQLRPAPPGRSPAPATYTVQAGDTLGSIAEETGLTVGRLQELNPGLDPQTLTTGQRIRLRE